MKTTDQALAWDMVSTTYSSWGGTLTAPYFTVAKGDAKLVALEAMLIRRGHGRSVCDLGGVGNSQTTREFEPEEYLSPKYLSRLVDVGDCNQRVAQEMCTLRSRASCQWSRKAAEMEKNEGRKGRNEQQDQQSTIRGDRKKIFGSLARERVTLRDQGAPG